MGMNVVPIKELVPEEPKVVTLDLLKNMDANDSQNEKARGQLVVELLYKPFKEEDMPAFEDAGAIPKASEGTPPGGGELVVRVHEAQDVEGKHHTNPYVRILFRGEEKKTKASFWFIWYILKIYKRASCHLCMKSKNQKAQILWSQREISECYFSGIRFKLLLSANGD